MDKIGAVKAVMLISSIVVALTPIIQALSQYSWNIPHLITPAYSPPRINFSMRFIGVRLEEGDLYAAFELANLGEVRVVLESLNATAYGPDGAAIAPAMLIHEVSLKPGESEAVPVRISLNEAAFKKLASRIMEAGRVDLEVKGIVVVRVSGSKAAIPLKASLPVGRADLG